MKNQIKKIATIGILMITLLSLISFSFAKDVNTEDAQMTAYTTMSDIAEKTYYIKNVNTGQYLDIEGGIAAEGTNVWQYKFNGTQAQKWYIHSNSDGTYSIYTPLGNDGIYRYCLDISDGSADNYANVQIWTPNGTDAQKFQIVSTNLNSFVFFTKCSNFEKAVVLNGPTCDEGRNVDQYTFQSYTNETWILEPVNRNERLGIDYAEANYGRYVSAYPRLDNFEGHTADCANFVSQCLLASGMHYNGDWKVYKKNYNYPAPTNVSELDNSWELCQPNTSPWTSAKQFKKYWANKGEIEAFTVDYILDNPDEVFSKHYYLGQPAQLASHSFLTIGDAFHTMYITSYNEYNNILSFGLTYHSNSQKNKNLIQICQEYKNAGQNPYVIFYFI